MPDDNSRLAALRQGLTHSRDEGYVTIRVADLRCLLDQVENRVSAAQPPSLFVPEGDLNDAEQD